MPTNILLSMWAAMALTIYWIEFMRGPDKFPHLNLKPLNCEVCLPVWLFAAFYPITVYFCTISVLIAAAFTCPIITLFVLKLLRK